MLRSTCRGVALLLILLHATCDVPVVESKLVIIANYYNVLLWYPREYGGNDELRVIFDVRNISTSTFRYMPVVVDVAYDSVQDNAYCYLESAGTSYIMLLKWTGGRWCYQVLFDFQATPFSKYMYHSLLLMENFLYWTTDRFVMSGRLPGYEKRLLLQPAWNHLYSMSEDRANRLIYIAAFDYTENALFKCNVWLFRCSKVAVTDYLVNYIYFSVTERTLFVASTEAKVENQIDPYAFF
jgi:hypothetical protein